MELNNITIAILIVVFLATMAVEGYAEYWCKKNGYDK